MNQPELDELLAEPLQAIAAHARAFRAQLVASVDQSAVHAASELADQRGELATRVDAWERRAADIHARITSMSVAHREVERRLQEAQTALEVSEAESRRLRASVVALQDRLAEAERGRIEAEAAAARARAEAAHTAAFPEELRSISRRLSELVGTMLTAGDEELDQGPSGENVADAAGGRDAMVQYAARSYLLPVVQRDQLPSALEVDAARQLGTYWLEGASTEKLLDDAIDWVLHSPNGGRRRGIPLDWNSSVVAAGGDWSEQDAMLRVRKSEAGNRWVLHFAHTDRMRSAVQWHHAFEAFADGNGVTVRHVGGQARQRTSSTTPVTPPRFVEGLLDRSKGAVRHGGRYRSAIVHPLASEHIDRNFADELLANNRHYMIILIGAECSVPVEFWNAPAVGTAPLFPGALLFRIADQKAWDAMEAAIRASFDGIQDPSTHYGDCRSVLFVGRAGIAAQWRATFGNSIIARDNLRHMGNGVLLTRDVRWQHVMGELAGTEPGPPL